VVVVVGERETVFVVALPAFALHAYDVAVAAVKVVLCPLQMVDVPETLTVGVEFTVTVTVVAVEQPEVVPVTV
jgi:hypothetical protein